MYGRGRGDKRRSWVRRKGSRERVRLYKAVIVLYEPQRGKNVGTCTDGGVRSTHADCVEVLATMSHKRLAVRSNACA